MLKSHTLVPDRDFELIRYEDFLDRIAAEHDPPSAAYAPRKKPRHQRLAAVLHSR